ncbi:ATP-binding protein [Tumebacillus permanentifrigoris]|uniref:AAA domain-containing protein n=1 Tax=Tumebacillus permanentifrigoris TaxID=378543 RepID=A0A316DHS6_9BACL|nr:AAA family ATPase [Tumebacillus permanentifrigoris]PWK16163.1 AAA domain-containing protein [Tumebacillus permanentifrigoris]
MKLLKAHIDGFGRYTNRDFAFGDGLNVIYGKNEAGKSTLQHFLLAMLYGQKNPKRKRTVYLEEEQKYRPWQTSTYGGVLWFEVEGTEYRIERNLRREDEWVRLYLQQSGEEITDRFELDSRKEPNFAQVLVGADRDLFAHALCVGPVRDRDRIAWLRDSVRAGGESAEGDAPATQEQQQMRLATEAITKRLEALGSERAATKPYGQAVKLRDDRHRALNDALERERTQAGARQAAEQTESEWQEFAREEQMLRDQLTDQLGQYLSMQEVRRTELRVQVEQLTHALEQNRAAATTELANLNEETFRELQTDFNRLLNAKKELDNYQKRLDTLQAESKEASRYVAEHRAFEESQLLDVERMAQRLEWYEAHASEQVEETDESERVAMQVAQKQARGKVWMGGVAAVLTTPLTFLHWAAILVVLACVAFTVLTFLTISRIQSDIERWEAAREQEACEREAVRHEQERLEQQLQDLLARFQVDTPRQYRQKWNALVKAREQVTLYERQTLWLSGEVSRATGERDILARRLLRQLGGQETQASSLDAERLRAEIARWETRFSEARALHQQATVWERELNQLQFDLQTLESDLSRWAEIAARFGVSPQAPSLLWQAEEVATHDLDALYQSWDAAERLLLDQKSTVAVAQTRYATLVEGQKSLADLLLEKELADADLHLLTEEREALLLAAEVWGEVRDELYQAIAPKFAATLADVSSRVTQGRYGEVFLDGTDGITAVSPDSGYTVDLSALSEGTIDQISFAMGLALSGWSISGGERLPLLLDEPFRRYDDDRLDAVLGVLREEALQRQIFLFTCREQEVERVMQTGGEPVRLVELQDGKYGMIRDEQPSTAHL